MNAGEQTPVTAPRAYRNDVQGLRAVAALLVATYHIWFHRVSGAVDLFFFISAYFMTASLLRRVPKVGWREVPRFWGNLLKRMLPQAWFVIVATIVGAYFVVPMSWWRQTIDELGAAAGFFVNWLLAFNQVSYINGSDPASPVQHYWAMAVQMQVYLVWPVVIAAVVLFARQRHWSVKRTVAVALVLIGAVSLAYSVWSTAARQPFAYFDTGARVWEFAAGGLFAIVLDRIHVPRAVRFVMGWVGLIGLLALGAVVDVSALFPGVIALIPITCAAMLFVSGTDGGSGTSLGVDRILATKPLVHLGSISYGTYLWHWPLLVLWRWDTGLQTPNWWQGLIIIGLAIGLAELSTRYVEAPIRGRSRSKARRAERPRRSARSLVALGAMASLIVAGLGSWQVYVARLTSVAEASDRNPGAAILDPNYIGPTEFDSLQPALADAGNDWEAYETDGCVVLAEDATSKATHCWLGSKREAGREILVPEFGQSLGEFRVAAR